MPTNPYFNVSEDRQDQELYSDLVNECVQINGIDAFYMPRSSLSTPDVLFGDDPTKAFSQAYPVEMYVQSVDQFEGGEIFSKFGLEIRKQARFLVTRRSFLKNIPQLARPLEGDILYMKNFRAFFEIKYADEEQFFYTFGNMHIYGFSLICEKWNFNDEKVNTGITVIDSGVDQLITTYQYNVQANGTGSYQVGELVYQGANTSAQNANGTVVNWNLPTGVLDLKLVYGIFEPNVVMVGVNSNARFTLVSSNTRDSINNSLDNNSEISAEANTILNFSEENPFGQPVEP